MDEETLQVTIANKCLEISYQNAKKLTVNFYEIDLEVLFSRTPFLLKNTGKGSDFDFVKPNKALE